MYAVIQTGSKQYKVTKGDIIKVELLHKPTGETVEFNDVKLLIDDSNNSIKPTANSKVLAKVLKEEEKGEKTIIFHYRRRKDSKTKRGHRQKYSVLKIENIQQ
ncbi:MAG: 50S ribosomal protein L21 [bacterium]|nr:50S ribosomal protein L21 [bacterium]